MKKLTLLLFCAFSFSLSSYAPVTLRDAEEALVRYEQAQKEARFFSLYNEALNKVKEFEGLSLTSYADSHGMTIGYGHFMETYPHNPMIITIEDAERFLKEDFEFAMYSVEKYTGLDRFEEPTKVIALAHFVFNVGVGSFSKSTLLVRVKEGQPIDKEIVRWNKATIFGEKMEMDHLTQRRIYELKLYKS